MTMRCLVLLLVCSQLAVADGVETQNDEIVSRYREFAVSRLNDEDPLVASAALDALATLDRDSYGDILRETLRLPLTNPSVEAALKHLIGEATPRDLLRVKEIVAQAARKGEQERKKDAYVADAALIEFLALEVLLASDDKQARRFASEYLEQVVSRNPGPGVTQMELALDLVGRYKVKSAAARVKPDAREELQFAALSALAKLGQHAALNRLEEQFARGERLEPYMLSDSGLVQALGLTQDQIRNLSRNGSLLIQIVVAGQLARMGQMDELHAMTKRAIAMPAPEFVTGIVQVIGEYGDVSFVLDLDAIASNEADDLGKLWVARAVFQIMDRAGDQP